MYMTNGGEAASTDLFINHYEASLMEVEQGDVLRQISKQLSMRLKDVINAKPPFCSGTLCVRPQDLDLYYGANDTLRVLTFMCKPPIKRIDFANPSGEELQHLATSCASATFGRNDEDVLDKMYRKAGQLDVPYLSVFSSHTSGLANIILDELQGATYGETTRAEQLHQENIDFTWRTFRAFSGLLAAVAGRSQSFALSKAAEAPKSGPKGVRALESKTNIFLIPELPLGPGSFFKWSVGGSTTEAVQLLPSYTPEGQFDPRHVTYVAFFSEAEHEVMPVNTGYRVTITYGLDLQSNNRATNSRARAVKHDTPTNELDICIALRGRLGFGLRRWYPIDIVHPEKNELKKPSKHLKGSDAALIFDDADLWPLETLLEKDHGIVLYHSDDPDDSDDPKTDDIPIFWVTPRLEWDDLAIPYPAYGNSVTRE
ncbi:hypothetical protein OBBRIDRAFT_804895 [Obba rivulosa]|uniref:Fe2OG dioxygenase domain-containing protein n=1 Tax=Obba rivulosa TaxID=1052685 RepID=A0A8E2AQP3_9APHY|nr:hypothetical protein OBBRIDRAFT_804895 [Obba rivulosa]